MIRELSRRDWLRWSATGLFWRVSGWLPALAADAAPHPGRRRSCVVLWMSGGPSQLDTFDLKPEHESGGPFREIATSAPGLRISEHLPGVARHADKLAVIRSMSTKEGDHDRARFLLRTGRLPDGPERYPALGSLAGKELGRSEDALPAFVSIGAENVPGPGFLGPRYAPLVLGGDRRDAVEDRLSVPALAPPADITAEQGDARRRLLRETTRRFVDRHPDPAAQVHQAVYDRAMRLTQPAAARAFDLTREPARVRDRYGRTLFGQGCLLARRLVEFGVPFIEVTLGSVEGAPLGWDTHENNFEGVRRLCGVLDPAWSALMEDLKDRGLLESTLVVWMGEFGRTPFITPRRGRDHHPGAWTVVLAGANVRGGQVVGRTSSDGTTVQERPVSVLDLLATVCLALGIDPARQNRSTTGRPIRIIDGAARPLADILS